MEQSARTSSRKAQVHVNRGSQETGEGLKTSEGFLLNEAPDNHLQSDQT